MNPPAVHPPGRHRGPRWVPVLVACLAAWLIPVRLTAQDAVLLAPGDPTLLLSQVFPESRMWRPPGTVIFKVEIEHPFAKGGSTLAPWRIAPPGGWGSALRLLVTDATGADVICPFRISAPGRDQPLTVSPRLPTAASFLLDTRTTPTSIPPGTYTARAELAASAGDGWRGRVVSRPVTIQVLGPVGLGMRLESVLPGALVQGSPWGVRASLFVPPDRRATTFQVPGGSRDWPTNAQLIVRDAQGATVAWTWVPPRLPFSNDPWLSPGETYPAPYYRLPGAQTAAIPPGQYTVTARFTSSLKHAVHQYWNGTIESAPLEVTVEAPPAPPDIPTLIRQHQWVAEDALEEAWVLRIAASEIGVPTEQRLNLTRQAVAPLLRAESAAQQWLLLEPSSPDPAVMLSRILLAQDDTTEAHAWVEAAFDLDAARPVVDPDFPDLAPDPDLPNLILLQWRQQVDATPEVPDAQLTPELHFGLAVARGTGRSRRTPTIRTDTSRSIPVGNGPPRPGPAASIAPPITPPRAPRALPMSGSMATT